MSVIISDLMNKAYRLGFDAGFSVTGEVTADSQEQKEQVERLARRYGVSRAVTNAFAEGREQGQRMRLYRLSLHAEGQVGQKDLKAFRDSRPRMPCAFLVKPGLLLSPRTMAVMELVEMPGLLEAKTPSLPWPCG